MSEEKSKTAKTYSLDIIMNFYFNIKCDLGHRYYAGMIEIGTTGIMEGIVGKALTNSYHKRLAYLEGKKIVMLSDYAKSNKLSHSNLINKATRQTIEAFLEKGVWKIGEKSNI